MCEAKAPMITKTNSILSRRRHMLRGSSGLSALLRAAPLALAALSFSGEARAQAVNWLGGNGNWSDPTKWSSGTVPDGVFANPAVATPTVIGANAAGTVTINTNSVARNIQVGNGSTLQVISGATLNTTPNNNANGINTIGLAAIGAGPAFMLVDGTGSTWNGGIAGVRVGNGAAGTLTISHGGKLDMQNGLLSVGLNAGGTGTLVIDGGTVANQAAALRLGYNGATGTLNIVNGGTLSTTNLNRVGVTDAAGPAAATGKVTISGATSKWTITPGVPGSNGNLEVGSGVGANGMITVSSGATLDTAGITRVGTAGGTGAVTITGTGSHWDLATGGLVIGQATGSTGTVTIAAGATLNTSTLTAIGFDDGSVPGNGGGVGTLTVDGANSVWNAGGTIGVGGTPSAASTGTGLNGTLIVSNGGYVNATSQDIYVATNPAATGTFKVLSGGHVDARDVSIGNGGLSGSAVVDGQGSVLNASHNLVVANTTPSNTSHTLTVSNGGKVAVTDNIAIGQFGGKGTATVDGQGSLLTSVNGVLYVGNEANSSGTLNIANKGTVTASHDAIIGNGAGAGGTVNVSTGGVFNFSNAVFGFTPGATGTLNVASGGKVNSTSGVEIGWDRGTSVASVTGQDSALTVATGVFIGHDIGNGGTTEGTLTVADGGKVKAAEVYVGIFANGKGTFNIGAGAAAGQVEADVVMGGANSTINFNHNQASYTFANKISDGTGLNVPLSGSVNFIGSGTTVLTAVNTYTAATNINAGQLQVASGGSIANSVLTTVNTGAMLSGAGSVGDVRVASGGTIAPTGFATLSVKDITFAAGSTYQVGVNAAGQSGSIAAATAALQGGTVKVNAGSGNYLANTHYTILSTTGGVTGQFAGPVSTDLTFFNTALDYTNPNKVDLVLQRNGVSFTSVATTPNQRSTAAGVESLPGGNALYAAVAQQNTAGARTAFDALSGEAQASNQAALIGNSLVVGDTIGNRLSQPFFDGASVAAPATGSNGFAAEDSNAYALSYGENDKPGTVGARWPIARKAPVMAPPPVVYASWAQGFGSWLNKSSDGNAATLKSTTGGVLSGFDVTYMGTWRFGAAGGYGRTDADVSARASSLQSDSYHVAAYGGVRQGPFGLQAGAIYTWSDIASTRAVAFPGFLETVKASYGAATTNVFGEANYRFITGTAVIEPFAGFSYVNLHTNAINETGGVSALTMAATDRDLGFSTLGVRSMAALGQSHGMSFSTRGTLGWRHAFGDVDTTTLAAFAGGSPFAVSGTPITVDALLAEAGLDVEIRPQVSAGLSWSGQFGEKAVESRLKGQLTYRW